MKTNGLKSARIFVDAQITRIYSDEDESSCICGLNRSLLDKLEVIMRDANRATCSSLNSHEPKTDGVDTTSPKDSNKPAETSPATHEIQSEKLTNPTTSETKPELDKNPDDAIESIEKLTLAIQKLEAQIQSIQLKNPTDSKDQTSDSSDQRDEPIVDGGYLQGLKNPSLADEESLAKLNQSKKVDASEMSNALHLTIPNVVSNIFANIQNLTHLADQGDRDQTSAPLTSIDGDTLNSTSGEINKDTEDLFSQWLDHQLETLKLTTSTADYIRKSAMSLFSRILKQYISRVEKMGGSIESNVRRAAQVALDNTETLVAFILRNYINWAGGLMRIIGESVSSVGKQLDSTGDSIAHLDLNPFEIIPSVMESLPNPSDYSKYFRNFGKQLLGELTNLTSSLTSTNSSDDQTAASSEAPKKANGIIKNTMGALSKTLGSWLG